MLILPTDGSFQLRFATAVWHTSMPQGAVHPNTGKTEARNRVKYEAARKAFLKVMPTRGPGITQSEMLALMKKVLPASKWGTTQGWWTKTVQLDAEARGEITRDGGKPLRWKRVT